MSKVKHPDDLWDITDIPRGEILAKWFKDGLCLVVTRGGASMCAYVGVPEGHPLAGFDYDDLTVDVHGGLTFAGEGNDTYLPKGFYFYGWDYAHLGDYSEFYKGLNTRSFAADNKKWTLGEVKNEVNQALWDFKRLVKLAERIAERGNNENHSNK